MVLNPVSLTSKSVILICHRLPRYPALGLPIQQTGPFLPPFLFLPLCNDSVLWNKRYAFGTGAF